jgi:hypothetical protein
LIKRTWQWCLSKEASNAALFSDHCANSQWPTDAAIVLCTHIRQQPTPKRQVVWWTETVFIENIEENNNADSHRDENSEETEKVKYFETFTLFHNLDGPLFQSFHFVA